MLWGHLAQISTTPLMPSEWATPIAAGMGAQLTYRARVALDTATQDEGLVPGMVVQADVTLRSARLWQWLLRPTQRALGRLGNGAGPLSGNATPG